MQVGIVFGCFIPLHQGHIYLIERAIKENTRTIIGVCGYDDDRGKDFLPFRTRYELMKNKYKNNPNIIVVPIDDKKIGLTGKFDIPSWKLWCEELFKNANIDPNKNTCCWYTGEQHYADKLSVLYPEHYCIVADRSKINISGTKIRKDPLKNKQFIDKDFYECLKGKKI